MKAMPLPIRFLSIENVLQIHQDTIGHEGGRSGVRDAGLLDAAVAMPRQRFGGQWLHEDVPAMAGAYLYHLAKNHPFVDGNKRTAVSAMLMFLIVNNITTLAALDDLEKHTVAVAAGMMSKIQLTAWLREEINA